MSKFYCLCMSPAIDATVTLKAAPCGNGEIFKDVADVENVGGKTINVARWLALRRPKTARRDCPRAHARAEPHAR